MIRLSALLFLCMTVIAARGNACFEPFANATTSGGTAYAPGDFLFAQINAQGTVWYALTNTPVPPATGLPTIVPGSLSYPGISASSGNCVSIPAQTGAMGRMTLGFTVTTGEVYFSFLLKVTDLSALDTTGTQNNFFAGFGDTVGNQNATLLRAAARVYARRAGTGFNLGVSRNTHNPSDWVFESTQRSLNQVYLVAGRYDYDDHTASLWINPPDESLGGSSAPAANITATKGNDLNSNGIRAFVLGCRTNAPPGCLVDELRIATTWRSVTGGLEEAPVILTQPSSQAAPSGAVARFDVVASSTASLHYQWYKASTALQNKGDIAGVTSATLLLSNVTTADVGEYRVAVTNALGAGVISSNADLYVTGPAPRPNIVFILCDDLGYGDLGVFWQNSRPPGLPKHATPKLDTFASEGMQLRSHYCGAPVCAPSRASLFLGMHQGHANVRNEQWDKALAANHTLGSVLKQAGYATALIGKWGLGGNDLGGSTPAEWPAYPTRRGFDYFFGYEKHGDGHEHYPKEAPYSGKSKECYDGARSVTPLLDKCYTADLFTARAKKWIRDQHTGRPDQPFFLFLSFDTPHAAYQLPTQPYPPGGGLNGGLQWLGVPGQMINTAGGTIDSFVHPEYATATYDHDGDPQTPEVAWPETFRRFATSVRRIDDAVGDIEQLLRDLGIETNTIVVFTSDNGPTTEEYLDLVPRYAANFFDTFGPLDGIKRDLWEGGVRVPTLVRWPGTIAGAGVSGRPSQFQDWMPTFCELAGLPAPASSDGVSLIPTLTGMGTQRPSTIYFEYSDIYSTPSYSEFEANHRGRIHNQMQLVHVNGFKGVRHDVRSHADDFEIYDVAADPKETINLAAAPALIDMQQRMKDRVLRLRRADASAPRPYDNELVPPVAYPVVAGVQWQVRTQALPWVPEFRGSGPDLCGSTNGPTLAVCAGFNNVAVLYSGYIQVPATGDYTFYLSADTRAFLRLHDATVIDADFGYPGNTEVSAPVRLQAGLHPFRLSYIRRGSASPMLRLLWSGPGISRQTIPDELLFRDKPSAAWHREHFGEGAPAWNADDDRDGRSRLAEYAFGGEPMVADSSGTLSVWVLDDHLQMRFLRRLPGTHDLTYAAQTSTNLVDWVPAGVQEVSALQSATLFGFEEVVCSLGVSAAGDAMQYIRLTATMQ